ncbi:heavy-metal-associated domain-containing protein [Thalassovita sp.]|jgi:copper chaperone CopZ|uniref:heavy-metal-associated domain-containing protein n=1 Tax=Thalassovita sp. TaxID=1979401 RepID=UPI003B5C7A64
MPTFAVPGMSCSKCTAKIEKSVTEADPTALLEFDLDARTVEIDSADDADELLAAINNAGFEATAA